MVDYDPDIEHLWKNDGDVVFDPTIMQAHLSLCPDADWRNYKKTKKGRKK